MSQAFGLHEDPESLVLRYLDNPRADLKDLILVHYGSLVERVARRFSGLEPLDDLVQVGFIGLLNALSKFDPTAGVRFTTYATYLVAGEIKHYLRDRSQTIRQPAWLQELRHKVNRAASVLQQNLGRTPTEAEIAEEIGVSESAIREVFQTQELLKVASLDSAPTDDESDSDVERLDAADFCPEQLSVEDRVLLENAMAQLRDLERQVLVHFHFDAMNQTEIASKLGISCNYVSHILRQSLTKLRKIMSSEEQKDRVLRRQAAELDYDVLDAELGVYTEAYFQARLSEELHRASAEGGAVALTMVHVSGLESMRAFYGPDSVTDFLADVADFLKEQVRRLDIVCRCGASTFGIILPATGTNALIVRQRLTQKIEAWMSDRLAQAGQVRIEVLHASYPEDGSSIDELVKVATPDQHETPVKGKRAS